MRVLRMGIWKDDLMQFNSMFATMCVSDKNGEIKADFCLEVSLEYFFFPYCHDFGIRIYSWGIWQRISWKLNVAKILFQHWLACHGQSVEINTFKEVAGGRGIPEKKKKFKKKFKLF